MGLTSLNHTGPWHRLMGHSCTLGGEGPGVGTQADRVRVTVSIVMSHVGIWSVEQGNGTAPLRGTGWGEGKQEICRHCMTRHMAEKNNGIDFSFNSDGKQS